MVESAEPSSQLLLHLTELVRHVPTGAAVLDKELVFLAHSDYWAIFGFGPDLVGRNYLDVFIDLTDEWKAVLQAGVQGETASAECQPYHRANGSHEYVKWKVTPWHEETGGIGGVLVYVELITNLVQTQKQLAERDKNMASLFEHSHIGLNLCQMDGVWLESNRAFLNIIGYSSDEAEGLTYWGLTPRKYDAEEEIQLSSLATTKRYGPYEKEFIRKDGSLIPVQLNGFIVERDGEELIWSMIEDITERKRMEAIIEEDRLFAIQASKLATLGEMAAGVAHEINNPLAIIQGYADIVKIAATNNDLALLTEAAEAIQDAVERSAHIVTNLRSFARETDNEDRQVLKVGALIEDALGLTRTRIENHGVRLDVKVETEESILCNHINFSQVLINLLNNSFDAVKGKEGAWIAIGAQLVGECVEFQVSDSGHGIDPAISINMFNPFYTTKSVGDGTGLGLSISKGLIEALGGSLVLRTESPNTTFVIRLPLHNTKAVND